MHPNLLNFRNKIIPVFSCVLLSFSIAQNVYAISEFEKYSIDSKNKKSFKVMAKAGSVLLPQQGSSIPIVSYDLLNSSSLSPDSLKVSSTAEGFTATPLTLHNSSYTNKPFGNHFYHNGWDTHINADKYYEMTISGTKYVLDKLDFSLEQIDPEPSLWFMSSSVDNFKTRIAHGSFSQGNVTSFSTKSLSKLGVITGDITLRFYLFTKNNQLSGFANHECKPEGSELFDAGCGLPDLGQDITLYGWKSDSNPPVEAPEEPKVEVKSVLDKDLPTIVLIHGLSEKNQDTSKLWTGFQKYQAGGLIFSEFGETVNIIKYVWEDAFHAESPPNKKQYEKARNSTQNAGIHLSKLLLEQLGANYNKNLHFIGHSLGTIVSTYAIKSYIKENTTIENIQFTSLDRPDHVTNIGIWDDISDKEEKRLGFHKDFFYLNIFKPNKRASLKILLDNYYTFSGVAGVGDIASTGDTKTKIFNHKLTSPNDVDNELKFPEGILTNDHSGVQQWYRWTMNANNFPLKKKNYCDGINFDKPTFMASDLSPCLTGWQRSLNKQNTVELLSVNDGKQINTFSTVAKMDNFVGFNCDLLKRVFTCRKKTSKAKFRVAKIAVEDGVPFGTSTINIPVGTTNITFDYLFNNMEDTDYAVILIDGKEVWKISGSSILSEGKFYPSGFLPLNIDSGDHLLTISLYDLGVENAEMKIQNIEFHSVNSLVTDVDGDNDGVDSGIEALVPNANGIGSGDGNGDDVQDVLQNNVASLKDSSGTAFVTIDSTPTTDTLNGSTLSNVNILGAPSDAPDGLSFPYGLISFTVNGMNTGGVAKLALFFPRNPSIIGYYKKDINDNWSDIAKSITHESNKTKIVIEINDGSIYDLDGLANGSVTDPGGPVVNVNLPVVAQPIPTISFYGLLFLSSLLAAFGVIGRKRINT